MEVYLKWIYDAWEAISLELIEKSFKVCGITNAIDASEDTDIHCFKPEGPIPTGAAKLQQARHDKSLAQLLDKIDLSVGDDGDDEECLSDASIISKPAGDLDSTISSIDFNRDPSDFDLNGANLEESDWSVDSKILDEY